jgi:hypothetical protein
VEVHQETGTAEDELRFYAVIVLASNAGSAARECVRRNSGFVQVGQRSGMLPEAGISTFI